MGGYGSGGHNKIKGDITDCTRIDSYDTWCRNISHARTEQVKAGVYDATYFICPECGRRVRYLYVRNDSFVCRKCMNVNYPCQQLPEWKWAVVKKLMILKRLDVDIDNFTNDIEIMQFQPEWPEYKMSRNKFFKYDLQLFKYEMIFYDHICKTAPP